ncbi:hypothetical protein MPF19_16700 [Polaribacter sp. Z014]|uniref:hypothetical protein n=1 Tax=Polaribacter sp. Z014 TaxID=2927126 RepID=UPI0020211A4D|nr:hypothetical protein [Polaribacter sp. Z014]MCL7765065.1 hypothetical protein [Polaribacter sp. Z014]
METISNQIIQLDIAWKNIQENIVSEQNLDSIKNKLKEKQSSIDEINFINIKNTFGIYIFYIKPKEAYTLKTLTKNWTQNGYNNYPKIVQKRFNKYNQIKIDTEYVFYIGKSEKLGARIKEHITHKGKTATYSLKLEGRASFNKENISFSYWELPIELANCTKEIKQFIITQIETELRNKLNPWIGKQ